MTSEKNEQNRNILIVAIFSIELINKTYRLYFDLDVKIRYAIDSHVSEDS